MKVKTVTDRQIIEGKRYDIHVQGWKLSKQYSTILYKNINKEDIVNIALGVYDEFMHSLKSTGSLNKDKNYFKLWEMLFNTLNKDKHSFEFKKGVIKNVYYTSLKKIDYKINGNNL
mgnify:CR=1 FL=1